MFRKVDAELKVKHKGAILTHQEVTHYGHMLKEEALTEEYMHADGMIDKLIAKAFKTFEVLMGALMLHNEHKLIEQAFKIKLDFGRNRVSPNTQKQIKAE